MSRCVPSEIRSTTRESAPNARRMFASQSFADNVVSSGGRLRVSEGRKARVAGMPRIEDGEIVFDVRVEGLDDRSELVRATTKTRGVVLVPFFGVAEEATSAARE